jgi:hypothetical protein
MEASGQFHTLAALPLSMHPGYPLNRRLGRSKQIRMFWRREKCLAPTGIWTLDCPAHSLVTILTTTALLLNNFHVKLKQFSTSYFYMFSDDGLAWLKHVRGTLNLLFLLNIVYTVFIIEQYVQFINPCKHIFIIICLI